MIPSTPHAAALEELLDDYNGDIAAANRRLRDRLAELQASIALDLPAHPPIDAAAQFGAQPDAEDATGEVATAVHGRPSPSSAKVACPRCGKPFFPRGLGPHVAKKHRVIDAPAERQPVLPPQVVATPDAGQPEAHGHASSAGQRRAAPATVAAIRPADAPNPRSAAPLVLDDRMDRAVGE